MGAEGADGKEPNTLNAAFSTPGPQARTILLTPWAASVSTPAGTSHAGAGYW